MWRVEELYNSSDRTALYDFLILLSLSLLLHSLLLDMSFNNYYVKLVLQPSKAWVLRDTEAPL